MPWKARKGKLYYYRSVREGGRVRSEYIGAGKLAPIVAEIDQLRKERRLQERWEAQTARNEFAELAATPEALALLLEQAQSAAAAALVEAGYHQHKRQWRKKRADKNESQDKSAAS